MLSERCWAFEELGMEKEKEKEREEEKEKKENRGGVLMVVCDVLVCHVLCHWTAFRSEFVADLFC